MKYVIIAYVWHSFSVLPGICIKMSINLSFTTSKVSMNFVLGKQMEHENLNRSCSAVAFCFMSVCLCLLCVCLLYEAYLHVYDMYKYNLQKDNFQLSAQH